MSETPLASAPRAAPPSPSRPARLARRLAWLLGLGALALGLGWQHPLTRHRLLLVWTSVERRLSSTPGAPAASGDAPVGHWAHAGWASLDTVANSGASARAACARFRGVEVDVTFSSDLVPYLSHDFPWVGDGAEGRLSLTSAAEIEARADPALRLAALIPDAACEVLVLDVKTDHRRVGRKAAALVAALGERRSGVWVLSLSGPFLTALHALAPELRLGCEGYLPIGNSLAGFDVSSLALDQLTPTRDAWARRYGLSRLYWSARNEAEVEELRAWQPEAILIDMPRVRISTLPPGTLSEDGS